MNDKEFDLYLQDLSDTPPPEIQEDISPWRSAMSRIVWGIGWSTITLNFWNLDVILPAVGMMMLLLGFRSLRRENKWFAIGYGCAWVRLLWWLANFAISLTVFQNDAPVQNFQRIAGTFMLVPTIGLFLALRNGIRAVQRKAGLPEEGGTGLLICQILLLCLAMLQLSGWLALGFLVIYILTLRELYRTSKTMEEAGYAASPAPVCVSDTAAKRIYAAAIACIAVLCYLFLAKYPMDWKPAEQAAGDAVSAVRQELLDLGFPEEILDDLTEDEILACSGANHILVDTKEERLDQQLRLDLDEGKNNLRITYVGLRFPGERDTWKLIHHFRWISSDCFCGTEAIQMWPAYQSGNWFPAGEPSGRVLYDREGETFVSGYHFLGNMTTGGWFGPSEDIYAAFSFPKTGEAQRGYVIYDVTAVTVPSAGISSWFNYIHQYSLLQFPVQTALEAERTGTPNQDHCFYCAQSAFQFSTHTDTPAPIGG